MPERIVSGLIVATGLVAVGLGVAEARHRLRLAHRAYRRTSALHASPSGGWTGWFLDGFSGMTMGTQWLSAALAAFAWALAGLCLIGLGIRLFAHV